MKFRSLRPEEIECRIGQVSRSGSGLSLLLYKTSRVDGDILDETVGAENWQCEYDVINGQLFCTVSIWDDSKAQWIRKQDVGSPSNVEAEKGRSSDALKRACFRWGIGKELYTAPFIWVRSENCNIQQGNNGKYTCYDRFSVTDCEVFDGRIVYLEIANERTGAVVYHWGTQSVPNAQANAPTMEQLAEMSELVKRLAEMRGVGPDTVIKALNDSKAVTESGVRDGEIKTARQAVTAIGQLRSWIERGKGE